MSDKELTDKLDQLTPDNLLSVFRALLLCEISLDHIEDSLTVGGGQLINPLGDDVGIGYLLESDIGGDESRQCADVGMGRAA